ncbi:hypothetical protein bhYOR_001030 (plasmid) [Borrelia nietonii YOR]|nr:hypothetical protein bhYOR_001030 [Borrelia nietonii YOR]
MSSNLYLRLFSTVSILLSRSLISDFNSFLTLSILLSRSLISDFNSISQQYQSLSGREILSIMLVKIILNSNSQSYYQGL